MKGYVILLDESIVSVVPDSQFDLDFVEKYRERILAEKEQLPGEEEIDFRLRVEAVAEKIRRHRAVN